MIDPFLPLSVIKNLEYFQTPRCQILDRVFYAKYVITFYWQ